MVWLFFFLTRKLWLGPSAGPYDEIYEKPPHKVTVVLVYLFYSFASSKKLYQSFGMVPGTVDLVQYHTTGDSLTWLPGMYISFTSSYCMVVFFFLCHAGSFSKKLFAVAAYLLLMAHYMIVNCCL